MDKFEQWFINQDFYTNMRLIHGDALFIKDGDVYRVLPVQMTWVAWQSRQAEIDQLSTQNELLKKIAEDDMAKIERLESVINQNDAELKEKDKRIDELRKHSISLRDAAKSWTYTEREKNILISQADDIDRILGGDNA